MTLRVTDPQGNFDECSTTITVEDNTLPIAVCQGITVQLDATGNVTITPAQINNNSFDACGVNLSLDNTSFDCSNIGANTVTLTVTDDNGNSSTCTSMVIVEDSVNPTALCKDITVQLDASGNVSIVASDIDNGSNDVCGTVSLSIDKTSFTCGDVGDQTVTLTVEDEHSNTSTCTATVSVKDNVDPIALCQDLTVQLDVTGNATITTANINNGSTDACGIASLNLDKSTFDCTNIGLNTVTLTVHDNNGNSATCTSTVTVEDNIVPIASCQEYYSAARCKR